MRIALPCKLLSIGCCLFVACGLTAQPAAPQRKGPGNDQAFQVGKVRLPALTEEQLRQIVINSMRIEQLLPMPEMQRKSTAPQAWMQWRWLLYAVLAAAGLAGGWGAKQVLSRKSSRMADPSTPRVERLGLGANGRDGVWLRDAPPWENSSAADGS